MRGGFRVVEPQPSTRAVAGAFWAYTPRQDVPRPGESPALRVLPDGCTDLIAELRVVGDDEAVELKRLYVCGPTDRHSLVALTPHSAWVGVRFRHGMAGPVLGVHLPALFGRQVDADTGSPGAAGLVDRLRRCATVDQMLAALGSHLAATDQRSSRLIDRRTLRAMELLDGDGCGGVGEVARSVGVSERTVHRDVLAATGMAPKAFARVLRFQRAVGRLRSTPRPDLCSVAAVTGYADQSHMTREFHALAGATPSTFVTPGRRT